MPVATVGTMADVLAGLKTRLGGNELSLGPICTRVMLRTGVDLRAPRPDQAADPALVGKVVAALSDLGFPL
jgi:hypothetical protein